jgi:membrane protein implicated in regulation of membrane protease activity
MNIGKFLLIVYNYHRYLYRNNKGGKKMTTSIVLWVIIGIMALAVDVASSAFLFIWFTVGAITSIIAALLGYSFTVQLITFVAVSVLFLAVGYPLVKKTIKKTVVKIPTTEQGYIGREFSVDEDVLDKATIKIDGIYWTVKNEGELIKKGDRVKVIGIEGNKIVIRKVN